MRSPWRREPTPIEPPHVVNLKHAELETAKEILGEIFHVRPADIDDMIKRRLAENNWTPKEGLCPAIFHVEG